MDGQYPYEKLGLMYLGRELDPAGNPSAAPLLLKNKDLTTHGMIIGMTGSGKTGLGLGLIEEAIMDNVPSLVIDPKGDMGNLLLTFPRCLPEDFLPWIDPGEAAAKETTVAELAARTAKTWQEGLATWDQGPERIEALRAKTELTIYTPGSSAGVPVSVLGSFKCPAAEVADDTDTMNSLVGSTATSLLALIGIDGDPLQSREHLLLSSILLHFWRLGQDLTMEALIGHIVNPPFTKVGVFPLDTFYPQGERLSFAMRLNGIVASPTFAAWTAGEPLDIQQLLFTQGGTPRTAIFSLSHLSDPERMFFITMLLNRFIAWMRRQPGTGSLKAMLYMDEIFGFFPPVAAPPSKKPMLILLKQARAYGIGIVLATQNPVDLDYKGLANIGTWFVGRLQTSQDQDRVAEGIAGASEGAFDGAGVRRMLAALKGRQFLLHSAHLDGPLLFETRWVMSYLKGPLSLADVKKLMAGRKSEPVEPEPGEIPDPAPPTGPTARPVAPGPQPLVSQAIEQRYRLENVVSDEIHFVPWLAASASVRFYNGPRNIDVVRPVNLRYFLGEQYTRPAWNAAEEFPYALDECRTSAPEKSLFYPLPPIFFEERDLKALAGTFGDYLYKNRRLELLRVKGLGLESRPGEARNDFMIRLHDVLREKKDEAVEKLRQKYQAREAALVGKLNRALDRLAREQAEVGSKTADTLVSFGAAVVGAFFGRKTFSSSTIGRAASGVRSAGRVVTARNDVRRVEEEVAMLRQELDGLAVEIEGQASRLAAEFAPERYEIETLAITPRRSDIFDIRIVLLWEMVVEEGEAGKGNFLSPHSGV